MENQTALQSISTKTNLPALLRPNTVVREQPNKKALDAHIASLLIRIAKLYQIPNFDEENALLLAGDTIERFQCEPVEVLIKCLSAPPSTGEKNWRLTPDTINQWMAITLEREAEILEKEHQKQKTKKVEFEAPASEMEKTPETKKMIQDYLDSLSDFKKAPGLSDEYIKEYGQHKPKKVSHSRGYVQPSAEYVALSEAKRIWALENTDLLTGTMLPGAVTFEEWIKH